MSSGAATAATDDRLLAEAVGRLCHELTGTPPGDRELPLLWAGLEELGLSRTGIPESLGGAGGGLRHALVVLRTVSRFPAVVPLAETTVIAGQALAAAGHRLAPGITTAAVAPGGALELRRVAGGVVISGRVPAVPWARAADRLLLGLPGAGADDRGTVVSLDRELWSVELGENGAGEPRDDVVLDDVVTTGPGAEAVAGCSPSELEAWGALARATQMCGASAAALDLCVDYTGTRQQFGRPLRAFQAIQQHLAELAGEVVLAQGALDLAACAAVDPQVGVEVAASVAKARVGESAGTVARLAHQVHGAIGFTREYPLHELTRRLWAWRDEFGDERRWAGRLGRLAGGRDLWALLTSVP